MENENKNQNRSKKQLNSYLKYSGIGFQMIGAIILTAWLGKTIDGKMENHTPIFTLLFMLLGVVSSIFILIRSLPKNE